MANRRVESFLLRVVIQDEDGGEGQDAWRGRIQHITTGSERQFEQFQDVLAFIATHLRQHGNSPTLLDSGGYRIASDE